MAQDKSDIPLFGEASDQQLDIIWRMNAAEWAGPISTEAHIERERGLTKLGLTKGGAWKTWVLYEIEDEIIASCETFQKEILVSDKAGVRKERGYGIASVFTNPKYRKRGMANLLLKKVVKWMDGEGEGTISVLYSDIGELGWSPFSTRQLVLKSEAESIEAASPAQFQLIKDEHLEDLCDQDLEVLKKEHALPLKTLDQIWVAFIPTVNQILWHNAIEDYMAKAMFDGEWSRSRGTISESRRAWIIWHFNLIEKKCKIQRVVLLDKDEQERNVTEVASLLRVAQRESKARGIAFVVVWNPCEEVRQAADLLAKEHQDTKVSVEDRNSSIPSLRWRQDQPTDAVVWEHNEYYAWC